MYFDSRLDNLKDDTEDTGNELLLHTSMNHNEKGPQQLVLSFNNLSFRVSSTGGVGKLRRCCTTANGNSVEQDEVMLIDNISGKVRCGQMVSVMGPSGAGKTTLINMLTLRATYGVSTGEIYLGRIPFNEDVFKSSCFFVGQNDMNWPYLTVLETCSFAARLFGMEETYVTKTVEEVIGSLGLKNAASTYNSSLSGGQQRRLSLAIALLKKPTVLFLDEVTSGLDSASAYQICTLLRDIVNETNIMVICTIHQPSTKIFLECFDQLMLLSKGSLAYAGGTRSASKYFDELGYPVPAMTNPSEHYLELVNSDFEQSTEKVDTIINAWKKRNGNKCNVNEGSLEERPLNDTIVLGPSEYDLEQGNFAFEQSREKVLELPFLNETFYVLKRHFMMTYRDPVLYVGRCVTTLIANCIFALVYWDARKYGQDQVMSKAWLVGWFQAVASLMGAPAVYFINEEFTIIQGEQKNGMIRISTYVIAKFILTLPFIFIYSIFALVIPGWVIQNYPEEAPCFSVLLFWSLCSYVFESLAECLAVLAKDKINGMLIYVTFWVSSFLFAGLFLPLDELAWPLKIFYYITPFSYYIRSYFYLLYSDAAFDSCDPTIYPSEPICVESGIGSDVIEELNKVLPVFENNNTVIQDSVILLVMVLSFKALYIAGISTVNIAKH